MFSKSKNKDLKNALIKLEEENKALRMKIKEAELKISTFEDGGKLREEAYGFFGLDVNQGDNWFKSIFENAVSSIVFKNISGEILLVNNAFEKLIGYTSEEITGHQMEEYTFPEDLQIEKELLEKCISEGKEAFRFEKRFIQISSW